MEEDPSIVEYFAEHERYRCGYCGSKDTNYSHGMWAHQMSVQDYEDLIDRGWRRSGKYCYKPTMRMTCCPQYTIRCNTMDFKLNKSHKKIIKKVNKFLITGIKPGEEKKDERGSSHEDSEDQMAYKGAEAALSEKARPSSIELPPKKSKSDSTNGTSNNINSSSSVTKSSTASVSDGGLKPKKIDVRSEGETPQKHIPKPGLGPDPEKPKCRKAKEIRLEKKASKQSLSGDSLAEAMPKKAKQNVEKSLEDFLSEPDHAIGAKHKLEIKLHQSCPESSQFKASFAESYEVYKKYQMRVHKDPPSECDKSGFRHFLVDSPLKPRRPPPGPPQGYGSFHQHYLLDGKIIAVGVIDILPSCVSSVYLYYDPDYSFLGLGVYSALREIAFIRELQRSAPDLKYYYMGFYIHSCPKMRYKGQFVPSFIACPESYQWVPIEICRPKLDASVYARLSEPGAEDKDKDIDMNQVLCLHKGTMLPYAFYKMMKSKGSDEQEVKEYAGFVGKTCAERMLLVRK